MVRVIIRSGRGPGEEQLRASSRTLLSRRPPLQKPELRRTRRVRKGNSQMSACKDRVFIYSSNALLIHFDSDYIDRTRVTGM